MNRFNVVENISYSDLYCHCCRNKHVKKGERYVAFKFRNEWIRFCKRCMFSIAHLYAGRYTSVPGMSVEENLEEKVPCNNCGQLLKFAQSYIGYRHFRFPSECALDDGDVVTFKFCADCIEKVLYDFKNRYLGSKFKEIFEKYHSGSKFKEFLVDGKLIWSADKMKKYLFEYAIVYNPEKSNGNGKEPKIVVSPKPILAVDADAVLREVIVIHAKELEPYKGHMEDIDIPVRPFVQD